MNRVIKFRAWDSKQKKWLDEVPYEEYMLECDDWSAPDYGEMCEALSFYPHSPLGPDFKGRIVYEQYTGLKDKNGKEIYEGDILNTIIGEVVVIWLNSGFYFKFLVLKNLGDDVKFNPAETEIIGNIHESPELMQKCNWTK